MVLTVPSLQSSFLVLHATLISLLPSTLSGHCKRLRPIWKQVSESLDGSVGVVKVDATKNRDLADKFGVQGYPTLVYIHDDNKYYKFSGGSRALEDLVAFAREGYKEVEGKPLPPPPGWEDILKSYQKRLKKEYLMLEEDFYHIMELRKNAMVAFLVIGGVVGSFVGCGFGACCCRGGGRKKNKVD